MNSLFSNNLKINVCNGKGTSFEHLLILIAVIEPIIYIENYNRQICFRALIS